MARKSGLQYLAALALLFASVHGQSPSPYGQLGSSFPGACPINKVSDVIVTVVATLPESTTGPLSIAYSPALNYPYGNPVKGFQTSPTWSQLLNNTALYFSPTTPASTTAAASLPLVGLKFFGECKQNLLTLQATCSFVFDYSTRRLLDLLSKPSPAGGIPLGGTVTFEYCTLGLGNSEVSSPTCFESRGGAPKPVIVKISSKEPADVIPQLGFNACYKDGVGSPYKCLAFAIIQSCSASQRVAYGSATTTTGTSSQYYAAPTQISSQQGYAAPTANQAATAAGQQQPQAAQTPAYAAPVANQAAASQPQQAAAGQQGYATAAQGNMQKPAAAFQSQQIGR